MKKEILNSALNLFNKNGLKFTMDDLAKDLSISKKTIYKEFKDKEDILKEIIIEGFKKIKEAEAEIYNNNNLDIIEKIKKLIIVMPDRDTTIDFTKFRELKSKYPKLWEQIEEKLENDWDMALTLLQDGINKGVIKPLPLSVIKAMIEGTMEHILGSTILSDSKLSYNQALETMIEIIINGIKE